MDTSEKMRPIIFLTGGTSGLGYAIACRVLVELADGRIRTEYSQNATLILAARSQQKFTKTKARILRLLRRKYPDQTVTDKVAIEWVKLDLSSVADTYNCCDQVLRRYPYLTHIYLNAGASSFIALDWFLLFKALLLNFVQAVTYPMYLVERKSVLTDDKLGFTWQCNVFGHFLLAKYLLPLLYKSRAKSARIIWTGSIEGQSRFYDEKDHMATTTGFAYHSTKYQNGLLGVGFNEMIRRQEEGHDSDTQVRSFIAHPGICAGSLFTEIIGTVLDYGMILAFYIARLLGSKHHVVSAYKSAACFVFLGLASFDNIGRMIARAAGNPELDDAKPETWKPARFGTCTTRLGSEYIQVDIDDEWQWDKEKATGCLATCERVEKSFAALHGRS